jgi:ribosomal protein S18 acetylase RimI-like enzyme
MREYADQLGVDLSFQDFERELSGLPGAYAPPRGRLLLAHHDGAIVGCGALRPLDDETCEMKRLYVQPAARGHGLARALATRLIDDARTIGYARMRLDTLGTMTEALALYRSLGFVEIPAYRYNPEPGTRYLELTLRAI